MPQRPSLRQFLPVVLVLCLGSLLAIAGFIGRRRAEEKAASSEFALASENRVAALRREIESNLAALAALRGLAEVLPQMDRSRFERFAGRTTQVYHSIRALEWLPRVTDGGRQAFEQSMRQDAPGYEIKEGNPATGMRRAGQRAEYFPVQFLYPRQSDNESALGYDLASSALFSGPMQRARQGDTAAAAGRVPILEKHADGFGIPVLMPVFRKGDVPSNNTRDLAGFVMGIFQVADMYESCIRYVEPRGINVQIFDMSAAPGKRLIYFRPSQLTKTAEAPLGEDSALVAGDARYIGRIDVGGRNWVVVCAPATGFFSAEASSRPRMILTILMLVTFATAIYFWLNITHQIRLADTNAQLNREIEERMRAEQSLSVARDEALESSQLKSQFLANVSHEIRTPMNGVIGMTDLLLDTPLTAEQREIAKTVQTSGEALLALLNDILDLAQVEAGKLSIESREFCPKATLETVLNLLGGQARGKGLQLACSIDPNLPAMLVGDPLRLGQVLTNLIGNAIKFTEAGIVTVNMRLESEGRDCAVIRCDVKDTGIGIPLERRARLFQSFYQADGSMKRRFGGTGLGLAISKQLVGLMGGDIGVETEEGAGSNFWFTVRLARAVIANREQMA